MRYANFIGILLATLLVGGCTSFHQKSEALMTGRQVSAFMEDGVVPVNRELINYLVKSLSKEGYERDGFADSIDDEEYFDGLEIEMRQEYDREYRLASIACESIYEQTLHPYKNLSLLDSMFLAARTGVLQHSKAGRAMDGCLLQRGWEAGTKIMYNQISDLAWKRVKRNKK